MTRELFKFYDLEEPIEVVNTDGRHYWYTKPLKYREDEKNGMLIPLEPLMSVDDRERCLYHGIRVDNAKSVLANTKISDSEYIHNLLQSYAEGMAYILSIQKKYRSIAMLPGFIFYNGTYELIKL